MVHGKLITLGIESNDKQDLTVALVCMIHPERLNLIIGHHNEMQKVHILHMQLHLA